MLCLATLSSSVAMQLTEGEAFLAAESATAR